MINILHLRSSAGLYGAEHVILNLTQKESLLCKHHIVVFENHINHNDYFYQAALKKGISITKLNCRGKLDFATISTLQHLLKQHKSNIIHCHDPKSVFYASLATIFNRNIRKVVTMHGWTDNDSNMKLNNFIEKLCLPFFDKVIAVSNTIKKQLQTTFLNKNKIIYIANTIDTKKFIPADRQVKSNNTIKKLLIVGRLSPEKGHKNLFLALDKLNRIKMTNWQLSIIGDGELKTRLTEQVKSLKLGEQVLFLGVKSDMLKYYQECDIYVSSSLTEGMPLVILEAMSCQNPVVSTPVGAIPELIHNSNGGLLCKNSSDEALFECLEQVLQLSTKELNQLAVNGQQYIIKNYSLTSGINNHELMYKKLIE